jgi:hypothetical protein
MLLACSEVPTTNWNGLAAVIPANPLEAAADVRLLNGRIHVAK